MVPHLQSRFAYDPPPEIHRYAAPRWSIPVVLVGFPGVLRGVPNVASLTPSDVSRLLVSIGLSKLMPTCNRAS